ncbi:A24 family peptidase [Solimonas sp. SE-A11]|uniref:prepilin peptidase n=1 Tax=Solimonas sp. SE-A11 TaxID=3054954 RepID=UPI00259D06C6|nr:A24 family peptidase [Solimonas sp. SE-A11]MDM4772799.1 A24 family peptidase [Solimonas sp. SE-A11]
MTLIEGLQDSPGLLMLLCALLGLMVGSFLNVVILRLPRMLEISWKQEARQILDLPEEPVERLSLSHPPSTCPSCGNGIKPRHNIPVLGWLMLRGRCASCKASISVQYPLVEAATGLLSLACAWHFGWGYPLAGALVLTWALVALTVIDLRTMLLPDTITLPLMWLGLLLALVPVFIDLPSAVIGAAAGYLSLWSVYHLFRLLTGKEGMGYGDFKLLAALGAWMGWTALPGIILLSSVVGAVVGIVMIVARGRDRQLPIPFGPYLAAAGWLWLIWGEAIKSAYLSTY